MSVLIKLTTQVILVENEGGQSMFKGGTGSWKITKNANLLHMPHIASMTTRSQEVQIGPRKSMFVISVCSVSA